MSHPCTWWERTGRTATRLEADCPQDHVTTIDLGLIDYAVDWQDTAQWPEQCSECGHVFDYDGTDDCGRSTTKTPEYREPATGRLVLGKDLPAGALYDNPGYHLHRTGKDGISLMCVLPNGHHWAIDNRASNCTRPDDNEHRCWVRHGNPKIPSTMHVDKRGNTCDAGAGSISVPGWHGFLTCGELIEC